MKKRKGAAFVRARRALDENGTYATLTVLVDLAEEEAATEAKTTGDPEAVTLWLQLAEDLDAANKRIEDALVGPAYERWMSRHRKEG